MGAARVRSLAFTLIAFVAVFAGCGKFAASGPPEQGVHLNSLEGLPTGASDINYSYGRINRFADFKVTREQFDEWVKEQGFEMGVDPWTDKPYGENFTKSIHRLNHQTGQSEPIKISADDVWIAKLGTDGGGYIVAYIVKTGRAYYHWSSH